MASNQQNNTGLFVATTNVWDVEAIKTTDVNSDAFKELLVRLYQNIGNICLALNLKDSGYYSVNEFVNGQIFVNGQQVFRTVVTFGTLPNAGTLTSPHGIAIDNGFTFTRIYGAASNITTMKYIPLPYASPTLVNNIELDVNATSVTITTAIDYSAYTVSYVVLEYVKV